MSSAWFGLNTALRGLVASQVMMDIGAHNTANANTAGYSRQRVTLVASTPFSYPAFNRSGLPGQVGTGVSIATIARVRDAFVDLQLRGQIPLEGAWTARRDELSKVEVIFPEPDPSGLGSVLGRFWDSWSDLSADPMSATARAAVVEVAATLAGRLNGTAAQLASLADGIDLQVGQDVAAINDLAARIASLNSQIQRVRISGDRPNDLEDQRDALFDDLAAIIPARLEPQADGTVTVLVGGTDLVNGGRARSLTTVPDLAGRLTPAWPDGSAVPLGEARLGALVAFRDVQLASYRAKLDTLAATVADAVNAVHATGFDANGTAGGAVFTYTAGDAAATLAVAAPIAADARRLAAAGATGQPGNGAIAGAIADLRLARLFGGGSQTATDAYAGMIGQIGSDTRQAIEMARNQALVTDQLRQRRESTSGVSLDEEAADMIRFQRSYQASARVITVMDEMLDTLINRTGLVGL
ncbi:MAG: flagellar hook-associated protein FlgK [Anaerolinea sp.]|nr:flagellar hook-associated protein FlgK [Anaerolinea sp.]